MLIRTIVLVLLLCCADRPAPLAAEADLDVALAAADARLDALLATPEDGASAMEVELRCAGALILRDTMAHLEPDGIRAIEARLHGIHRGGAWGGLRLDSASDTLDQRLDVTGLDAGGLVLSDQALRGRIAMRIGRRSRGAEMGRGENSHSMAKAGHKPVLDWSIGGRERVAAQPQELEVDLQLLPEARLLELRFADLVGEARADRPPAADDRTPVSWDELGERIGSSRGDLQLDLVQADGHWRQTHAYAPGWNRGRHTVDSSALIFADQRLHGTLVITLQPDPWVPKPPREQRLAITIDLPVAFGHCAGPVQVEGPDGVYQATLAAEVWQLMEGRFTGEGYDGPVSGIATARLRPAPQASTDLVELVAADAAAAGQPGAAYRRLAARLRAIRQHPVGIATPLQQGFELHPPVGADTVWGEALVAQAARVQDSWSGAPVTGNPDGGDPFFGPWAGAEEQASVTLAQIPDPTAAQRWLAPTAWRVLGPFVAWHPQPWAPSSLPEVVTDPAIRYLDQRIRFTRPVTTELAWQEQRAATVRPPAEDWQAIWVADGKMSSYSAHPLEQAWRARENGRRSFTWYATTTIEAAAAGPAWLAIRCVDHGSCWIDGRLVWESGPEYDPWSPALFEVALQAGDNEILVRCVQEQIGYAPPSPAQRSLVSLQVAAAGAPRDAARQAAAAAARAARRADHRLAGHHAAGSRLDAAGDVPLAWDLERGLNVAWRATPGSAARPQVVDDLVVLTREPNQLLALSASDGSERWRIDHDVERLPGAELAELGQALRGLHGEARREAGLQREQKRGTADHTQELAGIATAIDQLSANLGQRLAALPRLCDELELGRRRLPDLGRRAGATPAVRDGIVYAAFGTGVVQAVAVDGSLRWQTALAETWTADAACSPLLVDDLLLVPIGLPPLPDSREERWQLVALAIADGSEAWRAPVQEGPPVALVPLEILGAERGDRVLLADQTGRLFDAADGSLLSSALLPVGIGGAMPPPVGDGDRLWYANAQGQFAVQFWIDEEERLAWRRLWDFRRSGWAASGPLVADGLLYVPRVADEFHSHNPVPWLQLDVYDAQTGDHLSKPKPTLRDALNPMPLVAAGELLLVAERGTGGMSIKRERSQLSFYTRGELPELLASRELSELPLRHEPVTAGPLLLLDLGAELVALRRGGTEGVRLEREILADALLAEIGRPPPRLDIATPEPLGAAVPPDCPHPVLLHGQPPAGWLLAGPLPTTIADPPSDLLRTPLAPGAVLRLGDAEAVFAPAPEAALLRAGSTTIAVGDQAYYVPVQVIDVLGAVQRTPRSTVCLATVLDNPEARVMRLQLDLPRGGAWLGGVRVSDGQLLRLAPGSYPLFLRIDVAGLPPVGRPAVTATFFDHPDPEQEQADWLAHIARRRARLARIVTDLPDSAQAIQARDLLARLPEPTP